MIAILSLASSRLPGKGIYAVLGDTSLSHALQDDSLINKLLQSYPT